MASRRSLVPLVLLLMLLLGGSAVWLVMSSDSQPAAQPGEAIEARADGVPERRRPGPREDIGRERVTVPDDGVPAPGEPESGTGPEGLPTHTQDGPRGDEKRTVEVTVVREGGGAVPGAHVVVFSSFGNVEHLRVNATDDAAKTDVEGKVTLDLEGGSNFHVRAWLGDSAGVSERAAVEWGKSTSVTVQISPGRTVRGRIVSTEGGGVSGADVKLKLVSSDPFGLRLHTVADDVGKFDLGVVPESLLIGDQCHFTVAARNHTQLSKPFSDFADATEILIELERGQTVRGRLVSEAGGPVAGVRMSAGSAPQQTSAGDGTFEITGVPWAGAELRMYPTEHAAPVPIRIPGEHGEIDLGDLVLMNGRPVSGTVVDAAGQPIPGATLRLFQQEFGIDAGTSQAGDDGTFTLEHVGEGEHWISASTTGLGWTKEIRTTHKGVFAGSTGVRVVVSGALSLLIQFKRQSDGEKVTVGSAEVDAWRADAVDVRRGQAWAGSNISSVRIPFEESGTYNVKITVPGYQPATVEGIEILPDREVLIDALFLESTE